MENCRICDNPTSVGFVIDRQDVPICEDCASAIFLQQAKAYAQKRNIFTVTSKQLVKKADKLHRKEAAEVLTYLYIDLLKIPRKPYTEKNVPKAYLEMISKQIEEGYTVKQLKAVCYHKYKEWSGNPEMKRFIAAGTLFRPTNFKRYVAEVPEDINPQNSKRQREILRELNRYIITGERDETSARLVQELKDSGYDKQNILKQFES